MLSLNSKPAPAVRQKPHPKFIMQVMEDMRALTGNNPLLRIKMDSGSKAAIAFTGWWFASRTNDRQIERRVFLETKKNAEGKAVVIFMKRMFDEDAVVIEYDDSVLSCVARDIQVYLRDAKLPD